MNIDPPFRVEGEQLEDTFYKHLETPGSEDWFYSNVCPNCKKTGHGKPRNFTLALTHGINELMPGLHADRRERTITDVVNSIANERAIHVIGGKFTGAGHFISLVGLEFDDNNEIENFIVDDSWGDYMNRYKPDGQGVYDGNNRRYPAHVLIDLTWGGNQTHPTIMFKQA